MAPPPHWMDVLMDVLLSQLARTSPTLPSAPLREAVEQVFRAFCADLTGTGGRGSGWVRVADRLADWLVFPQRQRLN